MSATTSTSRALPQAANDLAAEIRDGRWRHVLELGKEPPSACEEIIAELRARHPGLERSAYTGAITDALSRHRPPPWHDTLLFWFVSLTFVWAFFTLNPLVKRFAPVHGHWIGLLIYPLTCVTAACFLLRTKRSSRLAMAAINVAGGMSWTVFALWAVQAFAKSFWR